MAFSLTVAALLGVAIGSFLNVVIYRVPQGLSVITPPSSCVSCGRSIRWFDNIPVLSWLLLRGRCRSCQAPISPRYVFVELLTGMTFASLAALWFERVTSAASVPDAVSALLELGALLWFASITIALTVIDLDTHRLPDAIVLPSYPVLVALVGGAALVTGDLESAARAAAGAGILFALYLTLALVSPRGMGLGDVKLAGIIGFMLGCVGWSALVVGAMAAFLLGGLVGIVLILRGRASRRTGIPFGPWMLVGAWLGIMLGEPIAHGYLSLFGLE